MKKIKTKMVIGFVFGIIGLIIIVLNAYAYLSKTDIIKMSSGASLIFGLLFCIIGATLMHKYKKIKTPHNNT